jgi:hypothetical protein
VDGAEAHELRRAVDEIDAGEGRADERADAIERELKDVLGSIRGKKGVNDLADRDELTHSWIDVGARMHPL